MIRKNGHSHQGLEVVEVADHCHRDSSTAQLVAVRPGDLADDRGRVGEGECLGTGERVLGTGVGIRVGQGRGRDGGDVLGVDEGLRTVAGRDHDGAVDRLEERLAEVLHEPRRSQDGVSETLAAKQVEFDTARRHVRRRRVDAVGAEVGDVADASGLGLVEEHRHLTGEIGAHERSEQVDPVDALERGRVGAGLVPIEADVGARAGRRAYSQAACCEVVRDARAGLAGSAEHQDQRS